MSGSAQATPTTKDPQPRAGSVPRVDRIPAQIQRIAKVELHQHVDGSIPVSVTWRLMEQHGLTPVKSEAELEKLLVVQPEEEGAHEEDPRGSLLTIGARLGAPSITSVLGFGQRDTLADDGSSEEEGWRPGSPGGWYSVRPTCQRAKTYGQSSVLLGIDSQVSKGQRSGNSSRSAAPGQRSAGNRWTLSYAGPWRASPPRSPLTCR